MARPAGEIRLDLTFEGADCRGTVELPKEITGSFVWKGKQIALNAGTNQIDSERKNAR